MRRIPLALLALAVTALCACTSSPQPAAATTSASPAATVRAMSTAEMEKTIVDLEKKIWDMYNNDQTEELKKHYLPEYRAIYFGGIKSLEENLQDSKDIVVKSFSMSDEKVTIPVKDTALLTYKYTIISTYKGKKTGGDVVASSVWVNIGGEWKNALYTEAKAEPQPKK